MFFARQALINRYTLWGVELRSFYSVLNKSAFPKMLCPQFASKNTVGVSHKKLWPALYKVLQSTLIFCQSPAQKICQRILKCLKFFQDSPTGRPFSSLYLPIQSAHAYLAHFRTLLPFSPTWLISPKRSLLRYLKPCRPSLCCVQRDIQTGQEYLSCLHKIARRVFLVLLA